MSTVDFAKYAPGQARDQRGRFASGTGGGGGAPARGEWSDRGSIEEINAAFNEQWGGNPAALAAMDEVADRAMRESATAEEAIATLHAKMMELSDGGVSAAFDGLDVETANEMARELNQLMVDYPDHGIGFVGTEVGLASVAPGLQGHFGTMGSAAQGAMSPVGTLQINHRIDRQAMALAYVSGTGTGFFTSMGGLPPKGQTASHAIRYVVTHEFGHAVDFQRQRANSPHGRTATREPSFLPGMLSSADRTSSVSRALMKVTGQPEPGDNQAGGTRVQRTAAIQVSKYAATASVELAAESFVGARLSPSTNALSVQLWEEMGIPVIPARETLTKYAPGQPRDSWGRFASTMSGGGIGGSKIQAPGANPYGLGPTRPTQAEHLSALVEEEYERELDHREAGSLPEYMGEDPHGHMADLRERLAEDRAYDEIEALPSERRQEIADAYEAADPTGNIDAVVAYQNFAHEINDQYRVLTEELGIKVKVVNWDPYPNVDAMMRDVANNGQLYVLSTASTGGHPAYSNEQNDRFRAVHDAFGHAATGADFSRDGEEGAYQAHKAMIRDEAARAALATETRGQTAYLIERGDFPEQKAVLLPEELRKALSKALGMSQADRDNLFHLGGTHHASCGRWQPQTVLGKNLRPREMEKLHARRRWIHTRIRKYAPGQARDDRGRFASGGTSSGTGRRGALLSRLDEAMYYQDDPSSILGDLNALDSTENTDLVRGFKGRPVPQPGDRVAVYRDLSDAPRSGFDAHTSFSIKGVKPSGALTPTVQAHTTGVHITDTKARFDAAAHRQAQETGKRGVHAYVDGNVKEYTAVDRNAGPPGDGWKRITYYPDVGEYFDVDTREVWTGADETVLAGGRMWARGSTPTGRTAARSTFEKGVSWGIIEPDLPFGELAKYAPGQARDGYGRWASGGGMSPRHSSERGIQRDAVDVMDPTHMENLPEDLQADLEGKVEEVFGVTPDQIDENLRATMERAIDNIEDNPYGEGLEWYGDAHDAATAIADANPPMTHAEASAVIAALSPQHEWDSNAKAASFTVDELRANRSFSADEIGALDRDMVTTKVKVDGKWTSIEESRLTAARRQAEAAGAKWQDPRGRSYADMDPIQASAMIKARAGSIGLTGESGRKVTWSCGLDGISKGVRVFRGEPATDVLNGHKVRSFYNNIETGSGLRADSVTIDTHALSAAIGYRVAASDPRVKKGFSGVLSRAEFGLKGTYPVFADAYRRLAADYGLEPHQAQAIVWLQWRAESGD